MLMRLPAHPPTHTGMGLSCSITAELSKIETDAARAKLHFPDLKVLVFATSGKVSNEDRGEVERRDQKK